VGSLPGGGQLGAVGAAGPQPPGTGPGRDVPAALPRHRVPMDVPGGEEPAPARPGLQDRPVELAPLPRVEASGGGDRHQPGRRTRLSNFTR